MQSLISLCTWLMEDPWSPFQLVVRTLAAAIYAPLVVAGMLLALAAIPYYFWTLFTGPSWLHLYIGLVFVGVIVWLRSQADSPPPVRRGRRVVTLPDTPTESHAVESRSRSHSKIRRGR